MINVLYIRSSFDPGGTESLLLNLFNYDQDQIEFHYVLLKEGSLIDKLNSKKNIYYKIFRKHRIDFKVINRIRKIIKINNIRIVHTHQMIELFYACLLKLFIPKLRLYHTVHGYFDNNYKWAQFLEIFLIRFTVKTFTVSQATKHILIEKGYPGSKIEVLYNAVSLPQRAGSEELEWFKKKIKLRASDFIVGMIGNFVWWKDQLTLVKAYNLLKEELPNLKIVFIGKESEFSEKCKEEINPEDLNRRVFFLGAIENAYKYLSIFDLFVMSTLMDTFGIVVIEALMSRVPVLASDIEVMKELSFNGKYFELFRKQDANDLADKIKSKYKNLNEKKSLYAAEYASENYSYKRFIQDLKNKYNE